MRRGRLYLSIVFAAVLILIFTVGGLLWFNLTRMVPQYSGVLYVPGINETVEIHRDKLGIPHIYASSIEDLMFAQGFVEAQDRWWQMEFQRHITEGRIEELTGYQASVVGSDLFLHTLGLNRISEAALEAATEETRTVLEAYTHGVNAYLTPRHGPDLGLEYTLLGITGVSIEVEPWEPVDSVGFLTLLAWQQEDGDRSSELLAMRVMDQLVDQFGEEQGRAMFDSYFPPYPFDQRPTIVTGEDLDLDAAASAPDVSPVPAGFDYAALAAIPSMAGGFGTVTANLPGIDGDTIMGSSNSWAISGEHTTTGDAIMANDPHIGIQMPSIWYEIGLHCAPVTDECPYDLVGFSPLGLPLLLIGHNQHFSWGLTNAASDTMDLYMLEINPENPYQYRYNDEWRDMEVLTETIHLGSAYKEREDDPTTENCEAIAGLPLNDDGDIVIEVRVTHFGPVITDNAINENCEFAGQNNDDTPLALRWTGYEAADIFGVLVDLNKAHDWESFREALSRLDWPPQTVVYADIEGNIGYQLPGHHPIRAADHSGVLPVPGWTDEYEWRGYIPFELMPNLYNPDRGWIVTANHAPVPPVYFDWVANQLATEYGEDINVWTSQRWAFAYRGQRAVEMVSRSSAHDVASSAEIQTDNHHNVAEAVIPYLVSASFPDETLAEAAEWLAAWDLQAVESSPQAALYNVFWTELVRGLWDDQLEFATKGGAEEGGRVAWATELLFEDPENAWWDDITTESTVETRDDILAGALQRALDYMNENRGSSREDWRWGSLHTAAFIHNPMGLSGIGFIEDLFNLGPVPTSGGWATLNRASWETTGSYEVTGTIDSMRMIVDFGNLDDSRTIHSTGQSGHPMGPNYDTMLEDWRTLQYHAMNFSREAVETSSVSVLELRPSRQPTTNTAAD